MLKVTFDDRAMRRFVRDMPKANDRAVARSLNLAITRCRTQAARLVSDKRNIQVGRARRDMRLVKASPSKPVAMIVARGESIPLIEVKGVKRQTKKGVSVKVEAKARPKLFEGAFIQKMPSGHVGVFVRLDPSTHTSKGAGKGTARKNLPIVQLRLPSVPSTMVQEHIHDQLQAFGAPVYERELVRLLDLEMKRAGAR